MNNGGQSSGGRDGMVSPASMFSTGFRNKNMLPANGRQVIGVFPSRGDGCDDFCTSTMSVVLTVELSAENDLTQKDWDYSDAFIVVEYGSGSGKQDNAVLEVDAYSSSFPILGRSANFYLNYPIVNEQTRLQPKLDISIGFAPDSYGGSGTRSARRTIRVPDLDVNATSAILPIPAYAMSACLATNDVNTQVQMNLRKTSLAASTTIAIFTLAKGDNNSQSIVRAARGFSLTNTNVGGVTAPQVIFFLAPA